ncbi:hypothetical protein VNO78_16212 [Psophocarpus tetragonolobus]|uniref:Uncharacterized protein n=1 Tax=Psophocarpus tetragonolobus TaxID=3891 RepID=A0AAN9SGF0_PSOTE
MSDHAEGRPCLVRRYDFRGRSNSEVSSGIQLYTGDPVFRSFVFLSSLRQTAAQTVVGCADGGGWRRGFHSFVLEHSPSASQLSRSKGDTFFE